MDMLNNQRVSQLYRSIYIYIYISPSISLDIPLIFRSYMTSPPLSRKKSINTWLITFVLLKKTCFINPVVSPSFCCWFRTCFAPSSARMTLQKAPMISTESSTDYALVSIEQSCSETLEMGNGKAARAEKNWEFIIC